MVADSLSAIKHAKVFPVYNDQGIMVRGSSSSSSRGKHVPQPRTPPAAGHMHSRVQRLCPPATRHL